jgi:hypothetical protein
MLSRRPDLFAGNPDIAMTLKPSEELACLLQQKGVRVVRSGYTENLLGGSLHESPSEHIIATMARRAGLQGEIELRPRLILSADERAAGRITDRQIVIQSSGRAARFPIRNKEWFPERFAPVAAELGRTHSIVQIGSRADPPIPGTIDLRGRTTVRGSAAILANADLFIGLVGFLMHLARAVDCRGVIVYGGREAPWQSGYSCNENIFTAVPCAPCWLVDRCDHQWMCMDRIAPADVIAAARRGLQKTPEPLASDSIHLSVP